MAYLREAEVDAVLRQRHGAFVASTEAKSLLQQSIRASAAMQSFDVFLSHSIRDARQVLAIKEFLETQGLTVYVDWVEDPQLDRSRVTTATADALRERMRQSKSLIYAWSRNSVGSKWMPWELGFFDGLKGEAITVLPLVQQHDYEFPGTEFLGLYPVAQSLPTRAGGERMFVTSGRRFQPLRDFARAEGQWMAFSQS